jgi:hypothetical protein
MFHRVLIAWSNPLFRETVRVLLGHPEVEIMDANSECKPTWVEIAGFQPNAIIIEETVERPVTANLALQTFEICPWALYVIRLSLQDNEMLVYHREQQTVKDAGDLLCLILNT